ncbi:MAG: EAL domain-containing protein [Gammaproteobacteria bacterium]|nr:EAL domain-containing protein [Gammaproteobacteria bacterium]
MKQLIEALPDFRDLAARAKWQSPARYKRMLVHEILTLQIIITLSIGALAVGGLYWGGQWVLQDSYARWAMQWTQDLNELGAPLYIPQDNEVILRLERFVAKYPEISLVTYYDANGKPLMSIANSDGDPVDAVPLDAKALEQLIAVMDDDVPYLMETSVFNRRVFEISAPIWTEALLDDGLFDFDAIEEIESTKTLSGFVSLKLDYGFFHSNLLDKLKIAIMVLVALLLASVLIGRRYLLKALSSISDLQHPLAEIAKGNLDVEFKPADHHEISEIVEALKSTASALGERDAKLLELANRDALTGLFNRRRFIEELKKELRTVAAGEYRSALLLIDLDQFKYVNDTCGHPAGDRLLQAVATQLRHSVGDDAVTARFGGDEFVVLASGVSDREARILAATIVEDMRRLVHHEDDKALHIHCSVGMTIIRSGKFSHDELLSQADIACREAKVAGRNKFKTYNVTERESEQMAEDVGWVRQLREALDNDSFVLRFQPIVQVETGETSHHEVLLRMNTADGKMIGPDAFLPSAVRFGLMNEIDTWVVRNAIQALSRYRQENPRLRFTINLSANAFETGNLAPLVQHELKTHNVSAEHIIFEITESLAARQLHHVESEIAALREMGCHFALDDFGTGYSAFSYLRELTVDYIKIDGSFVKQLSRNTLDQKVVRLIGEVGHEAGIETIAEYVNTSEAFAMLAELGIDYAQGNFVGKPTATPIMRSMPIPIEVRRKRKHATGSYVRRHPR